MTNGPLFLIGLLLTFGSLTISSAQTIDVGPNSHVSLDVSNRQHVEASLAVNPTDSNNIVAASMVFPNLNGPPTVTTFHSVDGGTSWKRVALELGDRITTDPWVVFAADGTVYVACQPHIERRVIERTAAVVFGSEDGGRSWAGPTEIPFGPGSSYDHITIAVDRTEGLHGGKVYGWASQSVGSGRGIFAIALVRSNDGARTFSYPEWVLPNNFNREYS